MSFELVAIRAKAIENITATDRYSASLYSKLTQFMLPPDTPDETVFKSFFRKILPSDEIAPLKLGMQKAKPPNEKKVTPAHPPRSQYGSVHCNYFVL